MKTRFIWTILVALHFSLLSAQQNDNDSIKVLYIGNSFTYYNDMPAMLQKIAASQGVKIAYSQFTPGGQSFKGHLKEEKLISLIKQGKWNYIVLQEQSSMPSLDTQTVIEKVYPFAHNLDSIINLYSPNAQKIFYMTWGHKDGNVKKDGDNYILSKSYKGMQYRLISTYLEMTYRYDGWCAPVGIAWMQTVAERNDIELYHKDKYHPSAAGSYLAANVIFSTIYQQPYITCFSSSLPVEQAAYLQQVAQKSVLENLELINAKNKEVKE